MRIDRLDRELRRLGSEIEHDEAPPHTAAATTATVASAAAATAATVAATAAAADTAAATASASPQSPPAVLSRPRDAPVGNGAALAASVAWEGGAVPPLWGSGAGETPQWPLEPTPMEVPPAEREVLATHFAEAGEQMLAIAAVHKVGDKKRSERLLGVGAHRLLVLATKKRPLLSLGSASSRLRVCVWRGLLSNLSPHPHPHPHHHVHSHSHSHSEP